MICSSCQETNDDDDEVCFTCGKALDALTQGAVLASRYVIRQALGRGGMGYVYRAFDQMLEEEVAIKVIRGEFVREPEMAHRFRSEIRLARKVSHPNVCRIHEYGEDGGIRFLSMEFVEGVDLKRLLRDGPLPLEQGIEVGIQAAEGLQAVHAHGVIHRDLKPSNIMIDGHGEVRLMDFGIAKEANAEIGLTGTGQMIGTPEYMSPEHAQGHPATYPSDVYALGCLVFEMFMGAPPFHADSPLNTLYMHLHDPIPLSGRDGRALPRPLELVLTRALAKAPAARYTALGLAEALRESRAALGLPVGSLAVAVRAAVEPDPAAVTLRGGTVVVADRRARAAATTPEPMVTSTLGGALARQASLPPAIGRAPRRWPWAFGALGGLAAALLVGLALRGPAPTDVPVSLSARPSPVGTGLPPGPSPAPVIEVQSSPSAQAAAPPSPRAPAAAARGTISLVIVPPADVTLDGKRLGTVSIREVLVAPGDHVVRILHPDYKPLQRKVTVDAGKTETLVLDLAEKAIRKPASSGN